MQVFNNVIHRFFGSMSKHFEIKHLGDISRFHLIIKTRQLIKNTGATGIVTLD
jgi:hypothetical protein